MRLLVLTSVYPHRGHPFSGIFNEKSVQVLRTLCDAVEVLAPRPYVPPLVSFLLPRWKAYAEAVPWEIRNGVRVHRPAIPVIPKIGSAFWQDHSAFMWIRQAARQLHQRMKFNCLLSFDLVGAGGVAWRIGRDLGIPAAGWATGGDVRVVSSSSCARVAIRALQNLDVIFYQSHELLDKAAELLGVCTADLPCERHMVLPRGIPEPPLFPRHASRKQLRDTLGISNDNILVLSIGRVTEEKGIFELCDAISLVVRQDPRIHCVHVGSLPAFDETVAVKNSLAKSTCLQGKMKILPNCDPDKIWEYLYAADIFAFTSHNEGMPNSLLEAMAMGVPSIAFAIPPVKELEGNSGGLVTVPPFDVGQFAQQILHLAANTNKRRQIGSKGKARVFDHFLTRKTMTTALEKLSKVAKGSSCGI
jgi:teichuronic acid biosynthesis glycosyltransferase TuaC